MPCPTSSPFRCGLSRPCPTRVSAHIRSRLLLWSCISFSIFLSTHPTGYPSGLAHADDTTAENSQSCHALSGNETVGKILANADIFSNLTARPGSLAHESRRLIRLAEKRAGAAPLKCKENCQAQKPIEITFRTVPHKFLSDYEDSAHCETLLLKTQKQPLLYAGKRFKSSDEFSDWFQDFTSGEGAEGEDLYSRCDRSCSPQYETQINRKEGGELTASTKVICGHARDKDDNQYALNAKISWKCLDRASTTIQ